MPGFDGTGPIGRGPHGGGRGGCAASRGMAMSYGYDRMSCGGWGRGRRNRYYATGLTGWQRAGRGSVFSSGVSEEAALREEETVLENRLARVKQRIEAIAGNKEKQA